MSTPSRTHIPGGTLAPVSATPHDIRRFVEESMSRHWSFAARSQRLPDGRWVVTPGDPVQRCRTSEAARITGIPPKTLHRLADAGIIRRATLTSNIVFWWPAEIEAVIDRCASDPDYAARVRHAATLRPADITPRHRP